MFKKLFIILIAILLLSSCTKQTETITDEKITEENSKQEENLTNKTDTKETNESVNSSSSSQTDTKKPVLLNSKYTGELITDGIYNKSTNLVFVPDKETREYLKANYSFRIDESMILSYDNAEITKNLPTELGIYKVEIVPDIDQTGYFMKINSISITNEIGTIEYEGKNYITNNIDNNIHAKDKVCGLIVQNVWHNSDDNGIDIIFAGEIEIEGIYNLYTSGPYFNNINLGFIYADSESKKTLPTYNDKSVQSYIPAIFFTETNDLYKELSSYSAIGHGKFKISNYRIMYNMGTELRPTQQITQIISLSEKSKNLFNFNDNLKIITAITDDYFLVRNETLTDDIKSKYKEEIEQEGPNDMAGKGSYYIIGRENFSKIKLLHPYIYYYDWEEIKTNQSIQSNFNLNSDGYNCIARKIDSPHTIKCKFFKGIDGNNDSASITKNFATFIDGDSTTTIYQGEEILGLKAEKIEMTHYCIQNSDNNELSRAQISFSGETTVTGNLIVSNDPDFGYSASFYCDEKGSKQLPYLIEDTRSVWFRFTNENIQDILGTEPFEKSCKITIKNYNIFFAATEASNAAELVKIEEIIE